MQSDIGLRGRVQPSTSASVKETIPNGTALNVVDAGRADDYDWCKVVDGQYAGLYVARTYLAFAAAQAVADDPAAVG